MTREGKNRVMKDWTLSGVGFTFTFSLRWYECLPPPPQVSDYDISTSGCIRRRESIPDPRDQTQPGINHPASLP
ncbi:hypothetical protein Pcinc_023364 [Petrolisthes cinctipes]|uniref:Uncharacterized protein n=1 Tax=Petrolisthes cinctipes TaxID=88211 RepID=A0AAE1KFD7_PETCI|nr:hypothetical protein Pcinc_023364 [Petrolisthes cinctipes]